MGVDSPEGPDDVPPDRPMGHRDDQRSGAHAGRHDGGPAEIRPRQEYYDSLQADAAREQAAAAQHNAAQEQAAAEKWGARVKESRWMWGVYQRRWPPEEHPPTDKPADPPGSWREGDRYLEPPVNSRVDAACDRVAELEQGKISPALRAIEAQDPDRHLPGFEYRLKGHDRIKEKVDGMMKESDFSPEQAVSYLPDAIRYTFEYRESRYTPGVLDDIARLKDQGFELDKLKNSWSADQYRGINTQWIEPDTGQRFEVQFHTRISFEAKQLTHGAYERLRTQQADSFEELVLEAFQKKVASEVPVPPGAADGIPDYPERGTDAR